MMALFTSHEPRILKSNPCFPFPCFVHLSGERILNYYLALGRMPEFRGWPGRMGTLLSPGAPSNEQMQTKEDEKRVEVGCGLLAFCVSILDPSHGIIRADAISTWLWSSSEMGLAFGSLFPPQQALHWSLMGGKKDALALFVKTLSKGVASHCTLPANTEKWAWKKNNRVQDHPGLLCKKYYHMNAIAMKC